MDKFKILRNLGITKPVKTDCYNRGIAETETNLVWWNPLTLPYFLGSMFYIGFYKMFTGVCPWDTDKP